MSTVHRRLSRLPRPSGGAVPMRSVPMRSVLVRSDALRASVGRGSRPHVDPDVGPDVEVDVAVALDLLDAACAAGVSVPRALTAVGLAIGGERGPSLIDVAVALGRGASWPEAWTAAHPALAVLGEALRSSWEDGVPPAGVLRTAAEAVRRERHARVLEAAGRLGVRLVLPLGLCYLPAFVLVGLVPVLLSMAAGALGG